MDKALKTRMLMESFNKCMTESDYGGGTAKLIKTIENGWNRDREMLVMANIYEVNPPIEGSNYLLVEAIDSEYIDGSYLNTRDDSDDDDGYEYWPSQQCWAWPCDKNGTIIKDKYGDEREISKSVDHFIKPDEWITTFLKYKLIH